MQWLLEKVELETTSSTDKVAVATLALFFSSWQESIGFEKLDVNKFEFAVKTSQGIVNLSPTSQDNLAIRGWGGCDLQK